MYGVAGWEVDRGWEMIVELGCCGMYTQAITSPESI